MSEESLDEVLRAAENQPWRILAPSPSSPSADSPILIRANMNTFPLQIVASDGFQKLFFLTIPRADLVSTLPAPLLPSGLGTDFTLDDVLAWERSLVYHGSYTIEQHDSRVIKLYFSHQASPDMQIHWLVRLHRATCAQDTELAAVKTLFFLPLVSSIREIFAQRDAAFELLHKKDREIEGYLAQGVNKLPFAERTAQFRSEKFLGRHWDDLAANTDVVLHGQKNANVGDDKRENFPEKEKRELIGAVKCEAKVESDPRRIAELAREMFDEKLNRPAKKAKSSICL
mmetsp:Transcript_559/g.1398  ORF Transcript_559/g.1398 Transcript_559/m.1398 type:complete len:286 (-) Transcript_559:128-985(-)